jgi:small subunit ribosomal protein S16
VVKLRLKRFGRRHKPYYRLTAIDIRAPRNGLSIEELGTYDPVEKDKQRQVQFNLDRVRYWLGMGAQPSETVRALLRKSGVDLPTLRQAPKGGAAKPAETAAPAAEPATAGEGG